MIRRTSFNSGSLIRPPVVRMTNLTSRGARGNTTAVATTNTSKRQSKWAKWNPSASTVPRSVTKHAARMTRPRLVSITA